MKTVNVVGAIIVDENRRILVAQRSFSEVSYKSYKWEFAGGKIEGNESPQEALIREIREELDCEINVGEKLVEFEHQYPDFKLNMILYLCKLKENSFPVALEHHQIKWILAEELKSLDWLEADYAVLPLIQKKLLQL